MVTKTKQRAIRFPPEPFTTEQFLALNTERFRYMKYAYSTANRVLKDSSYVRDAPPVRFAPPGNYAKRWRRADNQGAKP